MYIETASALKEPEKMKVALPNSDGKRKLVSDHRRVLLYLSLFVICDISHR